MRGGEDEREEKPAEAVPYVETSFSRNESKSVTVKIKASVCHAKRPINIRPTVGRERVVPRR